MGGSSGKGGILLYDRYIGIDYSGANVPTASCPGLRVYMAGGASPPVEVGPSPSARKYWTRREIAEWLVAMLAADCRTIVGIDHGFSFPLQYFAEYHLAHDWPAFLDDFQVHWQTDGDDVTVEAIRKGSGAARSGNSRWRRLTDVRAGAKSVFHFDVPGSVAKSTHAGLPWLRYLRRASGDRVHFWPFDGWAIPAGRSAILEAYPTLCRAGFERGTRTEDQHDAYCVAAWLQAADRDDRLAGMFAPELSRADREVANIEGWILGVLG